MKKLLCIIGIIFATMMSTTAFAEMFSFQSVLGCLLYTSDAADD